jgi:hypothetical protein
VAAHQRETIAMGGTTFTTRAKGKSAREAFDAAVSHAQFMHGHGGYSGTIAEKSSFVVIGLPMGQDPKAFVEHLLEDDDPRVSDKWGPAGCIKVAEDAYLFFGWASC